MGPKSGPKSTPNHLTLSVGLYVWLPICLPALLSVYLSVCSPLLVGTAVFSRLYLCPFLCLLICDWTWLCTHLRLKARARLWLAWGCWCALTSQVTALARTVLHRHGPEKLPAEVSNLCLS